MRTNLFRGRAMRLAFTLLALTGGSAALAGTVITMESRDIFGDQELAADLVMYVDGGSLRLDAIDRDDGTEGSLIYLSDSEELIAIDHASREFVVLDRVAVQAMANQISSAMEQAEEALEELPPEQREFARQMLRQQLGEMTDKPTPRDVQPSDSKGSVAGISCEDYDVLENGSKTRELCVADWSQISGGDDIRYVIESMAGFFEDMRTAFSRDGFDLMGPRSDVFSHMRDIDGFPVKSADFDESGIATNDMHFVSSVTRDVDPALFAPPAGYTEQVVQ